MNKRVLAIAIACAVLMAGGVLFLLTRSAPATPETPGADTAAAAPPRAEASPDESAAASSAATPAPRRAPASGAPPRVAAAPSVGTLRIVTDVPGASVFLDRQFIGTAPLTAENVTPGRRQLNVSAEGFEGVAQTIDVEPGSSEISIRLRDVRLNAAIDVVHRHRLGSCRGRLVADVRGLRYETDHTEDTFSAPLADLQTFEVDYLERNLRVRLSDGRQYNFTDPEGNADPLFVFHRDVDNARQRLAAGGTPAVN